MEQSGQKYFEFEGSDVEEAIDKAVVELKIPREQIKVKVVSEEQKGLFGMKGAKPAKIMVSIKRIQEKNIKK